MPNQTSFLSIRKYTQDEINTLEKIRRLHYLLNSPSSTVDSNAVDSIVPKFGLNMTHISNVKEMLKTSHAETAVLVYKRFHKQLGVDPKWMKDPLIYLKPSGKRGRTIHIFFDKMLTMHGRKVEVVVVPALFSHEMDLFFARASLRRCKKQKIKNKKKNKHDSQLL